MKICAIICEFNPFHNGHKYILEQAKKRSGCDSVLCVMSGNFVQRAEYAIVSKNLRTAFALCNGADIVIELPTVFATASGELFAKGAIDIISQIEGVTHLTFGCENDDITVLTTLAKIQSDEDSEFKKELRIQLDKGVSYASAYSITTALTAQKMGIDSIMSEKVLTKPNNLLAIEYIKQLLKKKSDISLLPIKRLGSNYNDINIIENYSSATAIRNKITELDFDAVNDNIPQNCFSALKNEIEKHRPDKKLFNALVVNSLKNTDLTCLLDAGEGIDIKLKKNALINCELDNIIEQTKSKRYTLARIKRLCIQALLKINKDIPDLCLPSPLKLLGIKKEQKSGIGNLSNKLIIQNKDYDAMPKHYNEYLQIEKIAANVYSQITSKNGNPFYSNKLIIL